ncbi:MAG: aldose epimerase family protein [Bacteroidota bacterium]
MKRVSIGESPSGERVESFWFSNPSGMEMGLTNYGATLISVKTPDREGKLEELCLGFDTVEEYYGQHPHFGGVVGRYGNRIKEGKFSLAGKEYTLAINNGPNHLHGGIIGFDHRVWTVQEVTENSVLLQYVSPDGEEGYPGELKIEVRYTLTADDAVQIDYKLSTDALTVANPTNHAYFNLKDGGKTAVLGHELQLFADYITPIDANLIPTGDLRSVSDSPFDFRFAKTIGQDIESTDVQMERGGGYDHNYVINGESGRLRKCAMVYEPENGRQMEVLTTEPGVQFYSANFVNQKGRAGIHYQARHAFCLETQHYPDSPNQVGFPTTEIKPGEEYLSTSVYRFSAK